MPNKSSMTCYLSELIDRLGGTKKSRLGEKFALKSRYLIGRRSDPKRIKSRLVRGRCLRSLVIVRNDNWVAGG